MKWMEPFLGDGAMAGKIICPNEKCGAKLGNFDWAGVMCSCREWVTPVSVVDWALSHMTKQARNRASVLLALRWMKLSSREGWVEVASKEMEDVDQDLLPLIALRGNRAWLTIAWTMRSSKDSQYTNLVPTLLSTLSINEHRFSFYLQVIYP